jgi:hypothetical protein
VVDAPYTAPFCTGPYRSGSGTSVAWSGDLSRAIVPVMGKRILAGVLWLFAGWYLGNLIAFHVGLSELLGPVLGVVAAGAVAGDPLGLIWARASQLQAPEATPVSQD